MKKLYIKKEEAVRLRKSGYSYNYIKDKIGISKGTLSFWLGKIPYSPNKETISVIGKARSASGLVKSKIKIDSIAKARAEAKITLGVLSKRDLFMVGLGLYIGEGSKSGFVRIANADHRIIVFAIRWFREVFGVPLSNFSLRIHIYPDSDEKEVFKFWSKQTGFSARQFKENQVDYRKGKKASKEGKLPYGTAHLTVNSCGRKEFGVFLFRKIEAMIEEVLK